MTTMFKLIFCVLCIYCCYKVTEGQMVQDCCLKVSPKEIPKHIVRTYQLQNKGQGCPVDAVIFVTKRDKRLCAIPGLDWVNHLMRHMDRLTKKCKANNFQGGQCKGLKPKSK